MDDDVGLTRNGKRALAIKKNMPCFRFAVTKEKLQLRFTYQSFLHTSVHLDVT